MLHRVLMATALMFNLPASVFAEIYTIEGEFDGCKYGKFYPLTNGQYLRCESYKYFYSIAQKSLQMGRR